VRVTIVGPAFPLRGGHAHHVYAIQRDLERRGHVVQVISFKWLYPRLLFPGKTQFDYSSLKFESEAIAVINPLNPITWLTAVRSTKRFNPEVVVLQWWNPFFAPSLGSIARALRRASIPVIAECHNVIPHERTRLDRVLLRYALGAITRFITHSESDRGELLAIRPDAIVRVPPLPDLQEFRSDAAAPRSGRNILFFGLVRAYKGLAVLLEAMPRVLERIDCRLLIAGEFYEPLEKYQEIIRRHGIEPFVTIQNRYLPNEEVTAIFDRSDVLVMPYLTATQSAVARIALQNGLPVIASRAGGLAEVVHENVNGLLFDTGDPADLADRIVEYFENGLGPTISRNIREHQKTGISVAAAIEELAEVNESRVQSS